MRDIEAWLHLNLLGCANAGVRQLLLYRLQRSSRIPSIHANHIPTFRAVLLCILDGLSQILANASIPEMYFSTRLAAGLEPPSKARGVWRGEESIWIGAELRFQKKKTATNSDASSRRLFRMPFSHRGATVPPLLGGKFESLRRASTRLRIRNAR